MFNIHKSSNLQYVVKHPEMTRCKCRAAEPDTQALRSTWWLPHICTMPLEHSRRPLQRQNSERDLHQCSQPQDTAWLRWTCEGEVSRTACSSASFCSRVVCAQRAMAEQCQGQMPARREMGRIKGVVLLLCTVERLKHRAPFCVFIFKVTTKGRDDSKALMILISSTHSFFNAQNFVVRYPGEYST